MENEEHPGVVTENNAALAPVPQSAAEVAPVETHPGVRSELLGTGTVVDQVDTAADGAEVAAGKPSRRKKAE